MSKKGLVGLPLKFYHFALGMVIDTIYFINDCGLLIQLNFQTANFFSKYHEQHILM